MKLDRRGLHTLFKYLFHQQTELGPQPGWAVKQDFTRGEQCCGGMCRVLQAFYDVFCFDFQLNYTKAQAGYLSTVFEIGGVLGTALLGFFVKRYYLKWFYL